MGNPVMQWQVITPDPEAHARFYGELFDWKIDANNALAYRQSSSGDARGIDGGFWPSPPNVRPFVQLFVEVEDVPAAFQRALELGATAVVPPQKLPDGGELAILHDPTGMSFGLARTAQPPAKRASAKGGR